MRRYSYALCLVLAITFLSVSCNKKTSERSSESPQATERQERPERGGQGNRKPPQFSELLSQMDANKDGKLDITEVKGRLKEQFSSIDSNKDGFITTEEFKSKAPRRPKN